MEQRYAHYMSEFFENSIRGIFPSGIEAIGFAYGKDADRQKGCSFLVQVDGAKRVRQVFKKMAEHLGQPRELTSGPECGNTWLQCYYQPTSLLIRPAVRRPGEKWICSVFSTTAYQLPEVEHLSIEDVLDMRYQSSSSVSDGCETEETEEHCDARDLEVREFSIEIAQVLADYEKLREVLLTGYGHVTEYGRILVTGLSRIRTLYSLTTFLKQVLKEVPSINTVGVFDFKCNPELRSAGWEGNYGVLLGQSTFDASEE